MLIDDWIKRNAKPYDILRKLMAGQAGPACQNCGKPGILQPVRNMTRYDPSICEYMMCHQCAGAYVDFWTEQWREYHSSIW